MSREDLRFGVELDGVRATLVKALAGSAVTARTFVGTSPEDALAQALASPMLKGRGVSSIPVRIVAPVAGTSMRRIDVTAEMASRAAFEDAVYAAIPVSREGTTTAGLFFDDNLVGTQLGAGVAVVAPSAPLDAAYEAAGKRRTEVVPPPFALAGFDGLFLTIRHTNSELSLVVDGRPVAYRQLRAGGLDTVASVLGAAGGDGSAILSTILAGEAQADPIAAAELDRYVRAVAAEAFQTREHWARSGETLPEGVVVLGPGERLPLLAEHLGDVGLPRMVSDELSRRMAHIAPAERSLAVGGFLAAVTTGVGMPQASFPNPNAMGVIADYQRRDQRAAKVLMALGALLLVVLVGAGPVLKGRIDLASARADRDAAQAQLAAVQEDYQKAQRLDRLENSFEKLTASDPQWSAVVASVYRTAPAGTVVGDITAGQVERTITVSFSAETPGDSYEPLAAWLVRLREDAGADDAWSSSFAANDGRAVFTVTFTLDAAQVLPEDRTPEGISQ